MSPEGLKPTSGRIPDFNTKISEIFTNEPKKKLDKKVEGELAKLLCELGGSPPPIITKRVTIHSHFKNLDHNSIENLRNGKTITPLELANLRQLVAQSKNEIINLSTTQKIKHEVAKFFRFSTTSQLDNLCNSAYNKLDSTQKKNVLNLEEGLIHPGSRIKVTDMVLDQSANHSSEKLLYTGEMKDGQLDGKGAITRQNKPKLEGNFEAGKLVVEGKTLFDNGKITQNPVNHSPENEPLNPISLPKIPVVPQIFDFSNARFSKINSADEKLMNKLQEDTKVGIMYTVTSLRYISVASGQYSTSYSISEYKEGDRIALNEKVVIRENPDSFYEVKDIPYDRSIRVNTEAEELKLAGQQALEYANQLDILPETASIIKLKWVDTQKDPIIEHRNYTLAESLHEGANGDIGIQGEHEFLVYKNKEGSLKLQNEETVLSNIYGVFDGNGVDALSDPSHPLIPLEDMKNQARALEAVKLDPQKKLTDILPSDNWYVKSPLGFDTKSTEIGKSYIITKNNNKLAVGKEYDESVDKLQQNQVVMRYNAEGLYYVDTRARVPSSSS